MGAEIQGLQSAIRELRQPNYNIARINSQLHLLSEASGVTDLEWLYEVFYTGNAQTIEEATILFNSELEENYKPFR